MRWISGFSNPEKMLVRMGPENARTLKQKLREFRAELVLRRAGDTR